MRVPDEKVSKARRSISSRENTTRRAGDESSTLSSCLRDKAEAVSATVLALETGYTHVALTATARKVRTESVAGSAALAGGGVLTSGLLLAMGAFALPALIPVPVGLGLGYLTLKRYGPVAARIQLGLERALDNLEPGPGGRGRIPPRPPGLIDLLADEVRKALKP